MDSYVQDDPHIAAEMRHNSRSPLWTARLIWTARQACRSMGLRTEPLSGDERTPGTIWGALLPQAHASAAGQLSARSQRSIQLAQDATQETMTRIRKYLYTYTGEGSLDAWCAAILRNALNDLRKPAPGNPPPYMCDSISAGDAETDDAHAGNGPERIPDGGPSPEQRILDQETNEQEVIPLLKEVLAFLSKTMRSLREEQPEDYQTIAQWLRAKVQEAQGARKLPSKVIADRVGITEDRVNDTIYRIREHLRRRHADYSKRKLLPKNAPKRATRQPGDAATTAGDGPPAGHNAKRTPTRQPSATRRAITHADTQEAPCPSETLDGVPADVMPADVMPADVAESATPPPMAETRQSLKQGMRRRANG